MMEKLLLKLKIHQDLLKKLFNVQLKVIRNDFSKEKDLLVRAYDRKLRIVISEQHPDMLEPWYLVTNDFISSRKTIIDRYYHRFEIEEFFRDTKRLLGLEWVNCSKPNSMAIVLWFVIAGIWLLWHLEQENIQNQQREQDNRKNMGLSRIRYWFEQLRVQIYQFALKTAFENSA